MVQQVYNRGGTPRGGTLKGGAQREGALRAGLSWAGLGHASNDYPLPPWFNVGACQAQQTTVSRSALRLLT